MRRAAPLAFVATVLFSACGGAVPPASSTASVPAASEAFSLSAPAPPVVPPFFVTSTQMLRRAVPNPIPLGAGFSGSVTFVKGVGVSRGTSVTIASSNRNLGPLPLPKTAAGLFYSTFTVSRPVLIAPGASFAFSVPPEFKVTKSRYHLALYDPTNPASGWVRGYAVAAPGTSRTTLVSRLPAFLVPRLTYVFAFYAADDSGVATEALTSFELRGEADVEYVHGPKPPAGVRTFVREYVTDMRPRIHVTEFAANATTSVSYASDDFVFQSSGSIWLSRSVAYSFAGSSTPVATIDSRFPSRQLLQQPAQPTPVQWTNDPDATIFRTYADGRAYRRVVAADGSYVERGIVPGPGGTSSRVQSVERGDGSGYTLGPFAGGAVCRYDFRKPTTGVIDVRESDAVPSPGPGGPPCTVPSRIAAVPEWFPLPPALYEEADSQTAMTTPQKCGPAAGIAATNVARAIYRIDTIGGFVESSSAQTFEAGGNAVCVLFESSLSSYYGWDGGSMRRPVLRQSTAPLSMVLSAEVLWATGPSGTAGVIPPADAAALQAHFLQTASLLRDQASQ